MDERPILILAAVFLKFKNKNYTAKDIDDLIHVAFARDEFEILGAKKNDPNKHGHVS